MTDGPDEQGREPGPDERDQTALREGAAYQGALEAVFALLIGAGIGYWADTRLDSSPWLLVIGTAFGFAAFVVRLFRMGRLQGKG